MVVDILVPLLVAVIGVITYALATNGKVSEIGRIAFFCGLLWLVYDFAAHVVKF